MFELSRRYIKTGFVFFVIGLTIGLFMIVDKHVFYRWPSTQLITAHVHVLLMGFVVSLIMGVAIWMFPRPSPDTRYSPLLAEITYWLLTLGTSVRFAGEVISSYHLSRAIDTLIVTGSISQALAGVLFVYNMWSRVRPVGKQR